MKKISSIHLGLVALNFIAFSAGHSQAEIIPSDRRINWIPGSNVGVPGGIPRRNTIGANVKSPPFNAAGNGVKDDTAAIQAAINACPAGQVIYLPAGTYRCNGTLSMQRTSDRTFRGAGPGATTIVPYGGSSNGFIDAGSAAWPRPTATIPITGGAIKGSTTVSVSNTASIPVGKLIRIEEKDPSFVAKTTTQPTVMSYMFKVVSKTSSSVTFSPALPYSLTNGPVLCSYGDLLLSGAGFEDLTFDMTNSGSASAIFMEQAYGCWIQNVEVKGSDRKQLWFTAVVNCEIRKCYTHDVRSGGPGHEGIDLYQDCCWNLVEDNICYRAGFPMIMLGDWKGGCTGNVVSYNYCYNVDTGADICGADIGTNHGPHNMMNLFEGNVAGSFQSDGYYGSASHNTVFRNYFMATHPSYIYALKAINLNRWSTYFNIVGNVLGSPAFPASPKGVYDPVNNASLAIPSIYWLGYPNMGNISYSGTFNATSAQVDYSKESNVGNLDLNVRATLLRHGNYDYYNKVTLWDATIPDRTIPASLVYNSTPSWWPSGVAWPPIGPDRSPMTTSIPAQIRLDGLKGGHPPAPSNLQVH